MPAIPGATEAFVVASVDPPRDLVLTVPDGLWWQRCRVGTRARFDSGWPNAAASFEAGRPLIGSDSLGKPPAGHHRVFIERAYAALAMLPRPLLSTFATAGHRIMEARHLRGIQRRGTASAETGSTVDRWRRVLLSCGILASVLYVAMTLFVGLLWEGYSVASNVPSELASHRRPHENAVDPSRHGLRRPDDRVWMDRLGRGAAEPRPPRGGRTADGAHGVRAILAANAPARGAGRRRCHTHRHAAPRVGGGDRNLFHAHCRLWRCGAREAVPPVLDRDDGDRPRVRRGDRHVCVRRSGRFANAVGRRLGADQHRHLHGVDCRAGHRAPARSARSGPVCARHFTGENACAARRRVDRATSRLTASRHHHSTTASRGLAVARADGRRQSCGLVQL